jgi:hypothetical protein
MPRFSRKDRLNDGGHTDSGTGGAARFLSPSVGRPEVHECVTGLITALPLGRKPVIGFGQDESGVPEISPLRTRTMRLFIWEPDLRCHPPRQRVSAGPHPKGRPRRDPQPTRTQRHLWRPPTVMLLPR